MEILTQPFLAFICPTCHGRNRMIDTKTCSKCQGNMEPGNFTGTPTDWMEKKEHAFLQEAGQKIMTYACEKCGYMESYVKK